MKLTIGGTYLSRDGNIITILSAERGMFKGSNNEYYEQSGYYYYSMRETGLDLIAPIYTQLDIHTLLTNKD